MARETSARDWGFRRLDEQTARSNFALWISDLDRRRWFRRVVAERGGPSARSLDSSPDSLGPLGAWLLASLRAEAHVAAPSPGLLGRLFARRHYRPDAPPWAVAALSPPFDGLSDDGLRLIDEAAWYLTECYRARFPHSRCALDNESSGPTFQEPLVIGPGEVVASPVRMVVEALEPLIRSDASADGWLAELYDAWGARIPEELREPPRGAEWAYQQLSRKEARAYFEHYVETERERLDAFRDLVARLGGPSRGALDLSRDSLQPLGRWMLDAVVDGPRDGEVPLWAQTMPEYQLGRSGDSIRLIDGLATYFAAALHQRHPAWRWEMSTIKLDIDYQVPVLGVLSPVRVMLVGLERGRSADPPDGDWILERFDVWDQSVDAVSTTDADARLAVDDVEVVRTEMPGFDVEIWIPEHVEQLIGPEAFEALEQRFATIPGVRTLMWEDRELLYAKLERGTRVAELRDRIKAILRESQAS